VGKGQSTRIKTPGENSHQNPPCYTQVFVVWMGKLDGGLLLPREGEGEGEGGRDGEGRGGKGLGRGSENRETERQRGERE